jgi:hypothetical protein
MGASGRAERASAAKTTATVRTITTTDAKDEWSSGATGHVLELPPPRLVQLELPLLMGGTDGQRSAESKAIDPRVKLDC